MDKAGILAEIEHLRVLRSLSTDARVLSAIEELIRELEGRLGRTINGSPQEMRRMEMPKR